MRTRTVLLLALSFAVVVIAFDSRLAAAQGSPTTPVGGGWMKPVTGKEGGVATSTQPKLEWSWLGLGSGTFLPLTRTTLWPGRELTPVAQGRYWWAVKVGR